MATDLAALFDDIQHAVVPTQDARSAWGAVVAAIDRTGFRVPGGVRAVFIDREVDGLRAQLNALFAAEPPPLDLTYLYFGLFSTWNGDSEPGGVGFYVAGGIAADPTDALAEAELPYWPEGRYLESPLLGQIKAAVPSLGADYNVFDYGLMLGAGAVLARYATPELTPRPVVFVGFDCGDFMQVYPPTLPT